MSSLLDSILQMETGGSLNLLPADEPAPSAEPDCQVILEWAEDKRDENMFVTFQVFVGSLDGAQPRKRIQTLDCVGRGDVLRVGDAGHILGEALLSRPDAIHYRGNDRLGRQHRLTVNAVTLGPSKWRLLDWVIPAP